MSRCVGSQTSLASFARVRHGHRSHALIRNLTQLRLEALGSSGLSIALVRPTGIEPVLRVPERLGAFRATILSICSFSIPRISRQFNLVRFAVDNWGLWAHCAHARKV